MVFFSYWSRTFKKRGTYPSCLLSFLCCYFHGFVRLISKQLQLPQPSKLLPTRENSAPHARKITSPSDTTRRCAPSCATGLVRRSGPELLNQSERSYCVVGEGNGFAVLPYAGANGRIVLRGSKRLIGT